MPSNMQLRMTILNVPDDLSALKLRGWLLQQASDIQDSAPANSFVRIRVYLTQKQRLVFTQKKLDALLQSIVTKHAAIHGIELIQVQTMLTNDEMREAEQAARAELDEMAGKLRDPDKGSGPGPTFH